MPAWKQKTSGCACSTMRRLSSRSKASADRHMPQLARGASISISCSKVMPRSTQHPVDLAVLVHVADRRADVAHEATPVTVQQPPQHAAHVLERVVGVEAGAHERVALQRRQDVLRPCSRSVCSLLSTIGQSMDIVPMPLARRRAPLKVLMQSAPAASSSRATRPLPALAMKTGRRRRLWRAASSGWRFERFAGRSTVALHAKMRDEGLY